MKLAAWLVGSVIPLSVFLGSVIRSFFLVLTKIRFTSGNATGLKIQRIQELGLQIPVASRNFMRIMSISGGSGGNRRRNATSSGGDNGILTYINTALGTGSIYTSVKQYSNVVNGQWQGKNGIWKSLSWTGNQYNGSRSIAVENASAFNALGKKIFILSTGISIIQGGIALSNGDTGGAKKSGLDIIMSGVGTFGGPWGAGISGTYFFIDNARPNPHPALIFDPSICQPDNTHISTNGY